MNSPDDAAKALEDFANGPAIDLAESVTRDLARLAVTELFTAPLQQAIGGLGKAITGASAKPSVNVNMNVSGVSNAQSFTKSQGQISNALARAVADGQRYI